MSNNLPVILDSRAEEDIDAAAGWYAEQPSQLALEFLNAVDAVLEFISQFPQANREIESGIRRAPTRKFPFFAYYKVDNDRAIVFAVLHVRRSPETWRQRNEPR